MDRNVDIRLPVSVFENDRVEIFFKFTVMRQINGRTELEKSVFNETGKLIVPVCFRPFNVSPRADRAAVETVAGVDGDPCAVKRELLAVIKRNGVFEADYERTVFKRGRISENMELFFIR